MPKQDIIVIGASAGGVEAIQALASGFPPNLEAAVFVVLHIGMGLGGRSELPRIISRAGILPAKEAEDGEEIRPGRIYVARPNFHLQLKPGRIRLSDAPKENYTRPAINPLFRSAAAAYGPRVAGVILTGLLDDGAAGLAEIKRKGGIAVVQDPSTALYPEMPCNATRDVNVDYVVPLDEIPALLTRLSTTERKAPVEVIEPMTRTLTNLTCPECRGPLYEDRQGNIVEYRCRVGHIFTRLGLAAEHDATVERCMWETIVALEEAVDINERLSQAPGDAASVAAELKREQLTALKDLLHGYNKRELDEQD